jgi:regulatory factor X
LCKDCGIRPSTSAEAEYLQEYIRKSNNSAAQNSVNAARLANGELPSKDGSDEDEDDESEGANSQPSSKRNSLVLPKQEQPAFDMAEKTPTAASLFAQQAQAARPAPSYAPIRRRGATPQEGVLGASPALGVNTLPPTSGYAPSAPGSSPMSVRQLPHFPSIEDAVGAGGSSQHAVAARELWSWFAEHLDGLLESVRAFRFDQFEISVRTFWASLGPTHREVAHAPAVAGLMAKADAIVYDVGRRDLRLGRDLLTHITGGPRDPPPANAVAYPASRVAKPAPAGDQDGAGFARGARPVRQHLRRAQGRARRPLRAPRS